MTRYAFLVLALLATPARAHHVVDFIVSSTEEDGGQLLVQYDFRSIVPVSFNFAGGGQSIFSGTNPGFDTADGDEYFPGTDILYPIFDPGVEIWVVLADNDGGRASMKLNGVTLSEPGDTALVGTSGATPPGDLHRHPEWQLVVDAPPGALAESRIAFYVRTPLPQYQDSPVYTLTISNGHLPPPEYSGDGYDRDSVRCQAAVGKAVEPFGRAVYGALRRCLDRVQVVRAVQAAGLDDSKPMEKARRHCEGVPEAIARARAKASSAIVGRCGEGKADDFDETTVAQHLALVACRTQNVVAASYFRARTYLNFFQAPDGTRLGDALPCVLQTAGEEEGPS